MKRTGLILMFLVCCIAGARFSAAQDDYDVPQMAIELIGEGKIDEARVELNTFQRKQPGNPMVLFYLGEIEPDLNKKLWYFKEVERLADSTFAAEALYRRAELVFAGDGATVAKDLYARLTELYPESPHCVNAHYNLGVITLSEGNADTAESHFNKCIELDTVGRLRLRATAGLMECHAAAEDWVKARETALQVIGEKDDYSSFTPRALEVIALSWRKSGNEQNAREFTARLLENYPNSYQAYAIRQEGKAIAENSSFAYDSGIVFTEPEQTSPSAPVQSSPQENAQFSVQVGAYKEQARALKVKRTLDSSGFDARIMMKTVQNTHYYAVQVGYYITRGEAEWMVKRITRDTGLDAIVYILE